MSPKTRGTLKQQALGFTTKRSTATSNLKSKQPLNSPVSVPTTPKLAAVVESTEANGVEVEAKETAVRSSPRQRKTRATSKVESNAASKKRKLQEVEEAASPTEKEKRNLEKGKGVFKSRVSLENVEGRATPTRVDDSSDTESDDPRDVDTSDAAKKLRIRRHYGQVREKMGFLEPSTFLEHICNNMAKVLIVVVTSAVHAKGQTKEHHILRVFDL